MSLKTLADEYFKTLNPTAVRLCQDLEETKASYEDLWTTLTEDQKQQILSESIIKPEVLIKYGKDACKSEEMDLATRQKYAVKLVIDENCSYRDEHSGPFSFHTQSQRDLSGLEKRTVPSNVTSIVKPKPKVQKNSIIYMEDNIMQVEIEECDEPDLPRTGLDFLDNW